MYLLAAFALTIWLGFADTTLAQSQWTTNGNDIKNTNTGNVGIGTASPTFNGNGYTKLAVSGENAGANIGGEIGVGGNMTGTNSYSAGILGFYNSNLAATDKRIAVIAGQTDGATNSGNLGFFTYNAGTIGERMRIDKIGNVGIGTSAPNFRFEIKQPTGYPAINIMEVDSSLRRATLGFGINSTITAGWAMGQGFNLNTRDFYLYDIAANQARLYINTSGNVGIGTINPGSQLFVGSGTPSVTTLPGLNVALSGNTYISASNGTVNTFVGADASSYGIIGTLSNHPLGLRANNSLAAIILPNGNVGIGTSSPVAKLDVSGNLNASGTITGGNIVAKYQDVAEWVPAVQALPAGTVVVLNPNQSNQVMASTQAYDTRVAGVISARPGLVLGESGEDKVLVATTGRVKVKVDATRAPIHVGDLLVTGEEGGMAMKSEPVRLGGVELHRPGTLIGKALEPLAQGKGEILVLLSLQ
jgi:hypothetical protein